MLDAIVHYALPALSPGLALVGICLLILSGLFYLLTRVLDRNPDFGGAKFILLLMIVQACFGLIYAHYADHNLNDDSLWYHTQAGNIASGKPVANEDGTPTTYWPIGYSLILGLFYRLFGANVTVAEVLNIFFAAGITLFTYLIGRTLFSGKAARQAALVMAAWPSIIFFVILPFADLFLTFLATVIFYLSIKPASRTNTLLLGMMVGLATLTRPTFLFFPLVIAFYRLLRDRQWKPVLAQTAIIILITELILLPWQIRNYRAFDDFILVSTNGGIHAWMGNNPHASGGFIGLWMFIPDSTYKWMNRSLNEVEREQYAYQQAKTYIKSEPLRAIANWPKKIVYLYYRDSKSVTYGLGDTYKMLAPVVVCALIIIAEAYYFILGAAFLIVLLFSLRRPPSPWLWFVLGSGVYFTAINLPFIAEGRYHMPLLPLFALVAVTGKAIQNTK